MSLSGITGKAFFVQILESSSVHIDFVSMKNWRKTKEGNEMKIKIIEQKIQLLSVCKIKSGVLLNENER